MMYVVKLGSNPDNWTFFNTYESALSWLSTYPGSRTRPELNLTKPYDYR
ncbi:hypothetical protein ACIP79_00340 [Streptomyces sp. NPDC088747]